MAFTVFAVYWPKSKVFPNGLNSLHLPQFVSRLTFSSKWRSCAAALHIIIFKYIFEFRILVDSPGHDWSDCGKTLGWWCTSSSVSFFSSLSQTCVYVSSPLFSFSKTHSGFYSLFWEHERFLSVPQTERLVLILARCDLWGEAPGWNNIVTDESGYLCSRSGDVWVNFEFSFVRSTLCWRLGSVQGVKRVSTKFVQWKSIFSIRSQCVSFLCRLESDQHPARGQTLKGECRQFTRQILSEPTAKIYIFIYIHTQPLCDWMELVKVVHL